MLNIIKKGVKILVKEGILTFLYIIKFKYIDNFDKRAPYFKWIKENEKNIRKIEPLKYKPFISIIVPVYNVTSQQLIECIESVIKQTYDNWELCLVDDASTWDNVAKVLKSYENNEKIKIKFRQENGHISKATNDGIEMADGEFIAFLDCDDVLSPNALYEMAKKLNENPEYDFIYSDEDKITEDGKVRHMPHFKPDWSPDTLMSHMYTCHFGMYRREIAVQIGGLRVGYEGAQDYDFTLRFTERTNKIGHIAKILYHWRERAESTAINPGSKPYIYEAARKSKEDALDRRGLKGELEFVDQIYQYRVNYINELKPLVSIIIPSKDHHEILRQCIESIKRITKYHNYEIIVIDNGSSKSNRTKYQEICNQYNCIYHYEVMDFNFSKMCNIGASIAKGDYYLFLNDDIEVISSEWMERMLGQASLTHTGAVGAKLIYPDSSLIQHTGVISIDSGPVHYLAGLDDNNIYYFARNKIDYNCSAVTAACLMVNKSKFHEISGFDEKLAVTYNDVDFCFKLVEAGYYNCVRTDVVLYHHESISRGNDMINDEKMERLIKERKNLYQKHPIFQGNDPFYNPNLTKCGNDFSLNIPVKAVCNNAKPVNSKILKKSQKNKVERFIDTITVGDTIRIEGWGFIKSSLLSNLKVTKIVLIGDEDDIVKVDTNYVYRPDVTKVYGSKKNLNFSGFSSIIDKNILKSRNYKVYISLRNILGKEILAETNKQIELK